MIIVGGCFDSTKSSNDEAVNQSVSGHTLRIFLYCSSRIVFLFYLTNYNYKYTKRPGKKQDIELPLINKNRDTPIILYRMSPYFISILF